MAENFLSLILYHPRDDDLSQALLRCSDLTAFLCQVLYPGSDPTGYYPDPTLTSVEPPATLLWWLSSLRVTLESLYCVMAASPPEALTTSLQGYLAQHPEQAPNLRRVLVEALDRDFTQWDQVQSLIASAVHQGESDA